MRCAECDRLLAEFGTVLDAHARLCRESLASLGKHNLRSFDERLDRSTAAIHAARKQLLEHEASHNDAGAI
jgi:hypothetical protein